VEADGTDLPPELTGFDRILLDAPCSGLGVLAQRPDLRWRASPEGIERLRAEQEEILAAARNALRPGGTLVYSVCTVNADETLGIVEASGLRVLPLGEEWPQFAHPRDPRFLQTLPHVHGTSGFFVSRLEV
jgi:16S rRNA (cytosine967-C5)-methyltransferase